VHHEQQQEHGKQQQAQPGTVALHRE